MIAAYNEGEEWLDQLLEYLDGTMEWVVNFLAEKMPKVKVSIPEGTYVMWMDFSGYGILQKKFMIGFIIGQMFCCRMVECLGKKDEIFNVFVSHHQDRCKEAFERIAKEFEDLN